MAIEARRGCGYRKVGGTYLVSSGEGCPCDRLPIRLDVCPVCSHGFKQSRGWTWVDLFGLVGGNHEVLPERFGIAIVSDAGTEPCHDDPFCPLCHRVKEIGKAGLLWIGAKFYKNTADFMREGRELGFSRRVSAIPRNFKVGETWVMLAHPNAIVAPPSEQPEALQKVLVEGGPSGDVEVKYLPGIFTLWRPTRVEKLFKESERDSQDVKEAIDKGITPVFVPDDDKDHQGTVYDKEEAEEETEVEHAPI